MSTYNVSVSSDAVVLPVAPPAVGESGGPDLTAWTPRLICPRASTSGRRCCLGHRWPPANSRSELWRSARAVDGGSRDHCVAQALASRRSPGARNRLSGAALADARSWAKAIAGRGAGRVRPGRPLCRQRDSATSATRIAKAIARTTQPHASDHANPQADADEVNRLRTPTDCMASKRSASQTESTLVLATEPDCG
jgi:hypothetical protein